MSITAIVHRVDQPEDKISGCEGLKCVSDEDETIPPLHSKNYRDCTVRKYIGRLCFPVFRTGTAHFLPFNPQRADQTSVPFTFCLLQSMTPGRCFFLAGRRPERGWKFETIARNT